ncbi:hypothetical protein DENSPDRAFT_928294 [Dentipellis sp. KUC8613]|nr:hypothetical protein DENSPDRAFT_928294 [Dentipellis sp. KUC8613]
MQLNELPTELLLIIFSLACTGPDTSTARALALTSHRIRAVSAPFLYQKLVLAGLPALSAGLSHLLTLPARNRHVQHLFLSDKPAPPAPEDEAEAAALSHDIESVYAVARTEQTHDADADEAALFPALADALLRLLAPDLQTLTVVVFNPLQSELFARLLAVPFPRLTSLALRLSEQRLLLPSFSRPPSPSGSQSPPPSPASTTTSFSTSSHSSSTSTDDDLATAPALAPHMPALTRLHFASPRYLSSSAAPLLALFTSSCPALARLRLSDLRLMPGCAATLARMLGRLPLRDQYGWLPAPAILARAPRLPLHVRQLVVQLERTSAKSEAALVQRMAEMQYGDGLVLLEARARRGFEEWVGEWKRAAAGEFEEWEGVQV